MVLTALIAHTTVHGSFSACSLHEGSTTIQDIDVSLVVQPPLRSQYIRRVTLSCLQRPRG